MEPCGCTLKEIPVFIGNRPAEPGVPTIEYCAMHNAAPELLKAAKWINAFISTAKDGGDAWIAVRDQPGAKEWSQGMQAAIAKATGETASGKAPPYDPEVFSYA